MSLFKKTYGLCVAAVLMCASLEVRAETCVKPETYDRFQGTVIRISGTLVPGFLEHASAQYEGDGIIVDYMDRLAEMVGVSLAWRVSPAKRADADFVQRYTDARIPAFGAPYGQGDLPLTSAWGESRRFVYTLSKYRKITHINELAGKRVGLIHGYRYLNDYTALPGVFLSYAKKDEDNLELLRRERVQAIIGGSQEIGRVAKVKGFTDEIHHDPKAPVEVRALRTAFHNTQQGEQLRNLFEYGQCLMAETGENIRILGSIVPH